MRFPLEAPNIGLFPYAHDAQGNSISIDKLVECANAFYDLMDQLDGIGIYIHGIDEGQWHGTEGLSFARAERALESR